MLSLHRLYRTTSLLVISHNHLLFPCLFFHFNPVLVCIFLSSNHKELVFLIKYGMTCPSFILFYHQSTTLLFFLFYLIYAIDIKVGVEGNIEFVPKEGTLQHIELKFILLKFKYIYSLIFKFCYL